MIKTRSPLLLIVGVLMGILIHVSIVEHAENSRLIEVRNWPEQFLIYKEFKGSRREVKVNIEHTLDSFKAIELPCTKVFFENQTDFYAAPLSVLSYRVGCLFSETPKKLPTSYLVEKQAPRPVLFIEGKLPDNLFDHYSVAADWAQNNPWKFAPRAFQLFYRNAVGLYEKENYFPLENP